MNTNMKTFIELPSEILLRVLSYLPHGAIFRCLQVCKQLNSLSNDGSIWKNLLIQRRGYDSVNIETSSDFKKLFRNSLMVDNFSKGRFVYRTLSKAYVNAAQDTLKFQQCSFLSPHTGVINTTIVPRWNEENPQRVEARSLLDINTLKITPLNTDQFKNMHVIFSCGYFIALKVNNLGPFPRQLFIYKSDPNDTVARTPRAVSALEYPMDLQSSYDAHIISHRYLMHSRSVNIGGYTIMRVYDLQKSVSDPLMEFTFEGHVKFMNEEYIVIDKRESTTKLFILKWKNASGKIVDEDMDLIEADTHIIRAAIYGDKLYTCEYDDYYMTDTLVVRSLTNKKVIIGFGITPDTLLDFRTQIVCFHDEFCFLYGEEYTIALDLKTGAVIQRISIGTIASIEPIFNEEGLCTKYYIVGKFNRGILDLNSPFINRKFEVVLLPAVHSIKAAVDKIQRAEVVYGDLSKTLPELCKAEPHHVESQVLLLKENKFRYTLIFNCKGEKKDETSRVVKKLLLRASKLPHSENCPVHCITLAHVAYSFSERLDSEGVNILQALHAYGPSILMYEEWCESYGWVPTNVPSSFSLKKFKKEMK